MHIIAIDLGSSFIKGAVLDLEAGSFAHVRRVPFPAPLPNLPPRRYEVDPSQVIAATRELLNELIRAEPDSAGVVMCSQMHGLVLLDQRGTPVSNMITWRDQRSIDPHPAGGTYYDQLSARISDEDRRVLGNELRPGLPLCALFWFAEQGLLADGLIPAPLPDYVLAQLCDTAPVTELTNGAAHGALNLRTGDWHIALLDQLGLGRLSWPKIQDVRQPLGVIQIGDRTLPCYPAIGDQQCALLGAALVPGELSLNISTGSQVSVLRSELVFGDYQVRPYFGSWLNTITHIPAGRALELLVALLSELAEAQQLAIPDAWDYISQAVDATPATDLQIDLAFFASALGDRGAIGNIHEGNLSVGHLFRAAFDRMAATYDACAHRLTPAADWDRLVFSGGLAQKIPALRECIVQRFDAPYRVCVTPEDTLQGLLALAEMCFSHTAQ